MKLSAVILSVLAGALPAAAKANAATTVTSAAASASATASTTCNPLSTSSCPADPALATAIAVDFTEKSDYFDVYSTEDEIFYGDDGLTLTLAERFDNPSLKSNFYIMFGRVEVELKSANGTGIVSSFYLQSDDLDEIDCEWFGGDASQMQSNFFSKGDTTTYDRGEYHDMADPRADYHTYTIDWTSEKLTWSIDGKVVRTLKNTTSEGYPQSPMYVMMGIWAGGDSTNEEGTIEWAGGSTDYSAAPFSMYIRKLVVSDYSTGTEYTYSDQSGDWTSIEAAGGKVNGREAKAEAEFSSVSAGSSSTTDSASESSTGSSTENGSSSSTKTSKSTKTSSGKTSSSRKTSATTSSGSTDTASESESATESSTDSATTLETITTGTESGSSSGSTSNTISVSDSGAVSLRFFKSDMPASSVLMIATTIAFVLFEIAI